MDRKMDMSRRTFLGLGATAAAGAAAFGLAGCSQPKASSDKGQSDESSSPHEWEKKPDPIADKDIKETVDCDVLIIGGGIAGMVAAQSAAEAGAKTILIEKNNEFSARGHDVACVNSHFQKEAGNTYDLDAIREAHTQITCNKTDIGLFNVWLNHSGECLDYYLDRMKADGLPVNAGSNSQAALTSVNPLTREYPVSMQLGEQQMTADGEYTNHMFVRYVEQYAKEAGADLRYNTPAQQLVTDSNGKVTGCIAKSDDGYVKFNAKNGVILATGGITQNDDMLKMWAPPAAKTDQILYTPFDGNTGDGLKMGMWVGAAHQKTNQATMALPSSAAKGGQNSMDGRGITWMTVSLKGKRYIREDSPGPNICHATLPQPESQGWSIFDGNWETNILKMCPSGKDFRNKPVTGDEKNKAIEDDIKNGLMFKADTIEDLANQMGIPADTLSEQVKDWNAYCAAGKDDQYALPAEKLFPIDTPPFYASRIRCGVLVVIYGLNVNAKSQVCDENDNPIDGLYAIGNCQGNFFTDSYPILLPGISHGRCVTFGRLVGQALANGTEIPA
jgi:fumarate reductase flavoprotein subunit